MPPDRINPVDVVLASAGTGKTTQLVDSISQALDAGLLPERVVATTFTNVAAEELRERARAHLVDKGEMAAATALLGARIGTVHSVCGNIISEFALDAGRSPITEILSERAAERAFQVSADAVIAELAQQVGPAARRTGLVNQWANAARQIVELARQNGIAAPQLAASADRSWQSLSALLSPLNPDETAGQLDEALKGAIRSALDQLPNPDDATERTEAAMALLREAAQRLDRGFDLPWQIWARLANIEVGISTRSIVAPVRNAAASHSRHPRLRSDLETILRAVFDCAARAMASYQTNKQRLGLLDFADQEQQALALLRDPEVAAVLKERIEQVFVDEFQDTSPIQLAIFTELAKIARRSTWVGDPKQAIYGFRGTDPELMALASGEVTTATGGLLRVLDTSYRSRPDLVSFVNDLFAKAAGILDLAPERIRIQEAARSDPPGMPSPLAVWRIPGSTRDVGWNGLAQGIRKILDDPQEWPVVPKGETTWKPISPSDIAVLCATNFNARRIADALSAQGIQAAVGRSDLLSTPEARLFVAAIRWVADSDDRLAIAEMAHLLDEGGAAQPAWFATAFSSQEGALERLVPFADILKSIRSSALQLTPREVIDEILGQCDLAAVVRRWGDPVARTENLEAIRALAETYQESCRQGRTAATVAGLIVWLDDQSESDDPPQQPASSDGNVVRILTYWSAKGLEWPLVVMADLDRRAFSDVFEPEASTDDHAMQWTDPLAGRWIRYWPWPYGVNEYRQKTKDTGLDARARRTPESRASTRRTRRESVRLLYVGMTRARDYLVFALTGSRPTEWLSILSDDEGYAYLGMPGVNDSDILVGTDKRYPARVEEFAPVTPLHIAQVPVFGATPRISEVHLPLLILPSTLQALDEGAVLYRKITLGERLTLTGTVDVNFLGEAVHRFLAADPGLDFERDERLSLANRILSRWAITALSPSDLLIASDRLHTYIRQTWPNAELLREVPVAGRRGLQRVRGRIDLLIADSNHVAIIDYKAFPGSETHWAKRLSRYLPQLLAYADLASELTGQPAKGLFVYLPITGTLLDVKSEIQVD